LEFLRHPEDAGESGSGSELVPDTLEESAISIVEAKETSLDLEKLAPLFKELRHNLDEYNTQAVSNMNEIRKEITSLKLQPSLKQLEHLITLYEFEEAQKRLTQLADQIGIILEASSNDTDTI